MNVVRTTKTNMLQKFNGDQRSFGAWNGGKTIVLGNWHILYKTSKIENTHKNKEQWLKLARDVEIT